MDQQQEQTQTQGQEGEGQRRQGPRETMREGIRSGLGILVALKEAIEETIDDMRARGDLSPDRAKEVVRDTMRRAQERTEAFVGDARERLDFVQRKEFDRLREEVLALRTRLERLEAGSGPEDVPVDAG